MSTLTKLSSKQLIKLTKKIIPPLLPNFYKGQCGKLVVIGGCEDYTGAPFFSAHSAAQLGCDLTHLVCELNAGVVIKSYSPDLMVHPYLRDFNSYNKEGLEIDIDSYIENKVMSKINKLLDKIELVIIGPGFGRDEVMIKCFKRIIQEIKVRKLPVIFDADALFIISQDLDLIRDHDNAVITPNVIEFKRIFKNLDINKGKGENDLEKDLNNQLILMSKELKDVTIVQKGEVDKICLNGSIIECDIQGSNKRVGGQGDSLSGLIGTLLCWGLNAYKKEIWPESKLNRLSNDEIKLLACFGGCYLTRLSSNKAFKEYGRSMQTSDLHKYIGKSYTELFN